MQLEQDEVPEDYFQESRTPNKPGPFTQLSNDIGEFLENITVTIIGATLTTVLVLLILGVLAMPIAAVKYLFFNN